MVCLSGGGGSGRLGSGEGHASGSQTGLWVFSPLPASVTLQWPLPPASVPALFCDHRAIKKTARRDMFSSLCFQAAPLPFILLRCIWTGPRSCLLMSAFQRFFRKSPSFGSHALPPSWKPSREVTDCGQFGGCGGVFRGSVHFSPSPLTRLCQ